jgi:hypothetical protein
MGVRGNKIKRSIFLHQKPSFKLSQTQRLAFHQLIPPQLSATEDITDETK